MKVLISRFVTEEAMDLSAFSGCAMQLAFFHRKVFRNFNHRRFAERLRENGISVQTVHAPATDIYHQAHDEFMTTLRTIREIYGVHVITLHPQRGEKRHARRYYQQLAGRIREMELILAYEPFGTEVQGKWISRIAEMAEYFEIMQFPFLQLTYDFVHAKGSLAMEEVKRYQDKIQVIHLSDALQDKQSALPHAHIPLGSGEHPVLEFLDLLKQIGYRNFLVLEYHPHFDHLLKPDSQAVSEYLRDQTDSLCSLIQSRRGRELRLL